MILYLDIKKYAANRFAIIDIIQAVGSHHIKMSHGLL